MKKVFLILILFLLCYIIYNKTIDNKFFYLTIGDFLSKGINEYGVVSYGYNEYVKEYLMQNQQLKNYNKIFTNKDYRIIDVIKLLEYNEKKDNHSLNRLIKQADIITISLGMNDLYYKLSNNSQNIYTYIDNMSNNYNKIFLYINKFPHEKVYVLGYYNINVEYNDVFNYANYKLEEMCKKHGFEYINLSKIFTNNPIYFLKTDSFIPNNKGYEKISQIIVENLKNN